MIPTRGTTISTSRTATPPSDEELDAVLRERYAERIRELARVPEQVRETYRDVWQQFYAWEPMYCKRLLQNLRATTNPSALAFDDFISESGEHSEADDSSEGEDDLLSYDQWFPGSERTFHIAGVAEEVHSTPFSCERYAYPKYEACTPARQNIKHELDVRILQFLPYDDPSFMKNIKQFGRLHAVFAWQHFWYDVDFKLISLEAVYRLHSAGVSPEVIDQYSVDFFPLTCGPSGLIATMHHRDILTWGDSFSSNSSTQFSALEKLRPRSALPPLGKSIDGMTTLFCNSGNCHEALCMLHRQRYPPFALDSGPGRRKDFRRGPICGPNCFRSPEAERYPDVVEVNQEIYEALRLFPNELSCSLAKLCKTTCIAVFAHRELVIPGGDVPDSFLPRHPNAAAGLSLCIHSGPCTKQNGCPCADKEHKCQRRCRCECKLVNRTELWDADVDLSVSRKPAPVRKGRRNVAPNSAFPEKKGKGNKWGKHKCSNMMLQARKPKNLAVYKGSFGLGTFANSDIPKDSLLGEYIAEYFVMPLSQWERDRADEAQLMVNKHRGLNYLFTLNGDEDSVLDAATVGDPTRCLNHPEKDTLPNVEAEEINVDGDFKIIFKSGDKLVKKGKELLLHYGDTYWLSKQD